MKTLENSDVSLSVAKLHKLIDEACSGRENSRGIDLTSAYNKAERHVAEHPAALEQRSFAELPMYVAESLRRAFIMGYLAAVDEVNATFSGAATKT